MTKLETPKFEIVYPNISESELDFSGFYSLVSLKKFIMENIDPKYYVKVDFMDLDQIISTLKNLNMVSDPEIQFGTSNNIDLHILLKYKLTYISILSDHIFKDKSKLIVSLDNFDHNYWDTSLYGIIYNNLFDENITLALANVSGSYYKHLISKFDSMDYFLKNYPCKEIIKLWTTHYFDYYFEYSLKKVI